MFAASVDKEKKEKKKKQRANKHVARSTCWLPRCEACCQWNGRLAIQRWLSRWPGLPLPELTPEGLILILSLADRGRAKVGN